MCDDTMVTCTHVAFCVQEKCERAKSAARFIRALGLVKAGKLNLGRVCLQYARQHNKMGFPVYVPKWLQDVDCIMHLFRVAERDRLRVRGTHRKVISERVAAMREEWRFFFRRFPVLPASASRSRCSQRSLATHSASAHRKRTMFA